MEKQTSAGKVACRKMGPHGPFKKEPCRVTFFIFLALRWSFIVKTSSTKGSIRSLVAFFFFYHFVYMFLYAKVTEINVVEYILSFKMNKQ